MLAVEVRAFGGPEVLTPTDVPEPQARPGHMVIRTTLAGVNHADVHQVAGVYARPLTLPFVPGLEVVGRTDDDRRVAALVLAGGYADRVLAPADRVFDVPDGVRDDAAAAVLLQGLTAWHVLNTCARLEPGQTVLVPGASGGVGSLAVQLARAMGAASVVAVASTATKQRAAARLGADVVLYPGPDLVDEVLDRFPRGLDVVLDAAGGDSVVDGLRMLGDIGRLVSYGMVSGTPPPKVSVGRLTLRSQSVSGFFLESCYRDPLRMLHRPLERLWDLVVSGRLLPQVGEVLPLERAAAAHQAMRDRVSVGKALLSADGLR